MPYLFQALLFARSCLVDTAKQKGLATRAFLTESVLGADQGVEEYIQLLHMAAEPEHSPALVETALALLLELVLCRWELLGLGSGCRGVGVRI